MNVQSLIARGAIFYCSTSGGKDSQAMTALLARLIPAEQLVYVHANLGEVEWHGVQDHINDTLPAGGELNVVTANWADGTEKTLLGMVENRGMWPSSAYRQCTSDLKRNPIQKFIRRDLKARGSKLAVNCMGIRSEESKSRAKNISEKFVDGWRLATKEMCAAGREVYDWYPLHDWSTEMVFAQIKRAGQQPHYAYAEGNERLSCCFCIMGSKNDLRNAARLRPELAAKYIALEEKIGHRFTDKATLAELIATDGGAA